ncbi:hypothetical protein MNBD_GAMMA12-1820 [hydrothermal vent metagenome]|uniref:DUF2971 domain-containing protein n=1 Tax=hydrothermal vent metagenome TaxID=652676 RepID=A0A3B0Y4X0_9ZZZZ
MSEPRLYRYTDLPSLIHLLSNRQLTLLDPMLWDDKNDSSYITLYREKCKLKSVLALCFARSAETYHHWKVFAPGSSGVRIEFDEEALRRAVLGIKGLQFTDVEYLTINSLRRKQLTKQQLPFLKRYPFKPEKECRLFWESGTEIQTYLAVPIELSSIIRITLSPWLHPTLVDGVKSSIKRIDGCENVKVYHSTLISNVDWLKHGEAAR